MRAARAPAAVVFDIGGVLERTPRTGWERRWAERLEHDPETFLARLEEIWRPGSTGETTLAAIEAETAAAFALDPQALARLMEDAWSEYLGSLDTAMVALVAGLRPRHRVALLSNSFVGARERERDAYHLEDMCEFIVYSHEVGLMKPELRIYGITCERLGVSPPETVFVDDVAANVEGARAAGMRAVLFESIEQTRAELRRHGVV